ncbi:MAG: hypothetical protein ACI9R3_004106 [Verrucomicrobiales bacterium]|jgi:hypothetical protein
MRASLLVVVRCASDLASQSGRIRLPNVNCRWPATIRILVGTGTETETGQGKKLPQSLFIAWQTPW